MTSNKNFFIIRKVLHNNSVLYRRSIGEYFEGGRGVSVFHAPAGDGRSRAVGSSGQKVSRAQRGDRSAEIAPILPVFRLRLRGHGYITILELIKQ